MDNEAQDFANGWLLAIVREHLAVARAIKCDDWTLAKQRATHLLGLVSRASFNRAAFALKSRRQKRSRDAAT